MSSPSRPSLSVIVVTYQWPEALDVILAALSEERDPGVEVIIADDGSGPATSEIVTRRRNTLGVPLTHVWQPDSGWRKSRILNLAAREARGDYFVFLDGDCIPRRGILAAVRRAALPGWFLASKRLNMSRRLSQRVLADGLPIWRRSALQWVALSPRELGEPNRPGVLLPIRDRRRPWRHRQPEFTPTFVAGFFFGVSRVDFERVNGFDMRCEGWGGEDEDIATRLRRIGLKCGWPGPRASMLHLWHTPKKGTMESTWPTVLGETRTSDRVEAVRGMRELAQELGADQESANRVAASRSSSEPVKR